MKRGATRLAAATRRTIRALDDVHVLYPHFVRLVDRIGYCHRLSKVARDLQCLLVEGSQGLGKTTLCRYYRQLHPPRRTSRGATVPVLVCGITAPASVKTVAGDLLDALGDPMCERGTSEARTRRLHGFLRDCGVEIILLDEFQHLIDSDSDRVLSGVADWLKCLMNVARIPVVLLGMPGCERILRANGQLDRRFAFRERMMPFAWSPDGGAREFAQFLRSLEKHLPGDDVRPLTSADRPARVFAATAGVPAHVKRLITNALLVAQARGEDAITEADLGEAYATSLKTTCVLEFDPFAADAATVRAAVEGGLGERGRRSRPQARARGPRSVARSLLD
jgi:type II secretory pathway predicted ATPase ExeA